jgi:outer membrane protein OmpA-like peptidoglycan-associated protein
MAISGGCTSEIWDRSPPLSQTPAGAAIGAASGAIIGGIAGGGLAIPIGAIFGSMWGTFFGNVIEAHQTLVERILYNGVQVIRVGDDVRLILPSDRFFIRGCACATLNPGYYRVLNDIATLLTFMDKVSVRVVGYTDDSLPEPAALDITRLQAQMIVDYLWRSDIDARLVYGLGFGSAFPIASNLTYDGRAMNRRIEITLRRVAPEVLV